MVFITRFMKIHLLVHTLLVRTDITTDGWTLYPEPVFPSKHENEAELVLL
jgi:hypothetical protein